MVKIRFERKEETQHTPKGSFPFKNFCYANRPLKCVECKKEIGFNDLGWFCNLHKKIFCWDCFDTDHLLCNKYGTFRNHADKLFTLKKEVL